MASGISTTSSAGGTPSIPIAAAAPIATNHVMDPAPLLDGNHMFELDSLRILRSYFVRYPTVNHEPKNYIDPLAQKIICSSHEIF